MSAETRRWDDAAERTARDALRYANPERGHVAVKTPAHRAADAISAKRASKPFRRLSTWIYAATGLFAVLAVVGVAFVVAATVRRAHQALTGGRFANRCQCSTQNQVCSSTSPIDCVECNEDTDCRGNTVCKDNQCVIPCKTAADCPDDKGLCDAGACTECRLDKDCQGNSNGSVCDRNRCVQCVTTSDCSDGQTCNSSTNSCIQTCGPDGSCPKGLVCQSVKGYSQMGYSGNICIECQTADDCVGGLRPFCCLPGENCGAQLFRCIQCVSDDSCGLGAGANQYCDPKDPTCDGTSPSTSPIFPGICDPQTKLCHGAFCHYPCGDVETTFLMRQNRESNLCVTHVLASEGVCEADPNSPVEGENRGCGRLQSCLYGNVAQYWILWRPAAMQHLQDAYVLSHTFWVDQPNTVGKNAVRSFAHLVQPTGDGDPATFIDGQEQGVPSFVGPGVTVEPNDAAAPTGFRIATTSKSGTKVYLRVESGEANMTWSTDVQGAFVAEQLNPTQSVSKSCARGSPPKCPVPASVPIAPFVPSPPA